MAGHSKWAKVKRFKGAIDAKRGKVFAKLSREITVAAKLGGGDPGLNPRLRMVLLKCRAASLPKDNIERALQKATGGGADSNFEELVYEIYAPGGVAILAEITTDNRNRAAAEVRSLVTKAGGSIAAQGAVSRLFQKRGQIMVAREAAAEDALMEIALEAGAEDFKADEQGYEILTTPAALESVQRAIEAKGIRCEAVQVAALPQLTVPVEDEATARAITHLIEALEDHDDVQQVYSNAELP
ncbi:MAG: YebC/PmpR family DNA-binding transcriptional regulator [Verrucomicrobia bacterium]|jgi:YebC/PmpR family DNA-binding regulatory protein|nr:YebC/PmpR family DNA-binding transcriptional regulator [Verrucomicrobiota bacterium]